MPISDAPSDNRTSSADMARLVYPRLDRDARDAREAELQRLGYARAADPDLLPGEYRVLVDVPAGDGPVSYAIEVEAFEDE